MANLKPGDIFILYRNNVTNKNFFTGVALPEEIYNKVAKVAFKVGTTPLLAIKIKSLNNEKKKKLG